MRPKRPALFSAMLLILLLVFLAACRTQPATQTTPGPLPPTAIQPAASDPLVDDMALSSITGVVQEYMNAQVKTSASQVQVQLITGEYARAQVAYNEGDTGEPAHLFLRYTNDRWQIIAGPATEFPPAELEQLGVPESLIPGNEIQAMNEVLQTKTNESFTLEINGIEANYASVELIPESAEQNASSEAFFKFHEGDWEIVTEIGATPTADELRVRGVPEGLITD